MKQTNDLGVILKAKYNEVYWTKGQYLKVLSVHEDFVLFWCPKYGRMKCSNDALDLNFIIEQPSH